MCDASTASAIAIVGVVLLCAGLLTLFQFNDDPKTRSREELLRDRPPYRTVTATGTHNPVSPSLSSSFIPFFRLANTGCALVCESHGYEVDLVARTYF
jgi:hypothetical protein